MNTELTEENIKDLKNPMKEKYAPQGHKVLTGEVGAKAVEDIAKGLGEEKEEVIVGFGDELNFMELFRCLGKQGLFTLRGQVNKSGMVGIMGFLDYNRKYVVHNRNLVCLGQLSFQREAGHDPLKMSDVFNNLFDYFHEGEGKGKSFEDVINVDLMDVMVPNYDADAFKPSHAQKVFSWYKEVYNKLKEMEVKADEATDKE